MAVFKRFKKLKTQDPIITKIQDNISDALDQFVGREQLDSNILKNINLTVGTINQINHLLGRTLVGWKVIRKRSMADVYDLQDSNPTPAATLWLISNANVTVDLEVF